MGVVCDRCGVVNEYADRFCGVCGFAFISSLDHGAREAGFGSTTSPSGSISTQYTANDIDELMELRAALKKEDDLTESLRQGDIDDLFG